MIISGYWESEKIFVEFADLVRRGGKVKPNDIHQTARERYIRYALERISALTPNPEFFVFSDDIAWCRRNLPNIRPYTDYTFIEGQTPVQDMALMTLCRHVIVGVSTFSWWGAWLKIA